MENYITDLKFDKSYNKEWDCFTAYLEGQFITGSNETGTFKIMNYKNVHWTQRDDAESYIENEFKKLNKL